MKQSELKKNVMERLTAYIRDHSGDRRLPSLRTISSDLGISIYLIRKQLDTLQREGVLKRRDRIGVFLTPERLQLPTVGIITNPSLSDPYIDSPDLYAGVLSALSRKPYLVRSVAFKHFRDIPKAVKKLGLSGLIWVEPQGEDLAEMVHLVCVKNQIPLAVCGQNIYRSAQFRECSNLVSLDYEKEARLRAMYFILQGKKHIAYCAMATASLPVFRDELSRHGVELPEECVITQADLLAERLQDVVRKYKIDGILCDGSSGYYENLFAFLTEHPDFRPLLSLENHPRVHCQLRKYPEVRMNFQFEPWGSFYFRMGERTADMLFRSMSGERIQNSERDCFGILDQNFQKWFKNQSANNQHKGAK